MTHRTLRDFSAEEVRSFWDGLRQIEGIIFDPTETPARRAKAARCLDLLCRYHRLTKH